MPGPTGLPALFTLDGLEQVEQILRPETGADPDRGVEEIRLVEDLPDRLSPPYRRPGFDRETFPGQPADRLPEVGDGIADVGTETEPGLTPGPGAVRAQLRLRSRVTSTEAPSITTGIGGSGLVARTVTVTTGGKRSSSRSPITVVNRSRVR